MGRQAREVAIWETQPRAVEVLGSLLCPDGHLPEGRFRPITSHRGGGIDLSFVRVADDTAGADRKTTSVASSLG
jgi:hypothetical protein